MKNLAKIELETLEFININNMLSYSCKLNIPISQKQVEIFFETDSLNNKPSQSQLNFIEYIIQNYDDVLNIISEKLSSEFAEINNSYLKEAFELDTLGIALNINEKFNWDLSLRKRSKKLSQYWQNLKE